MIQFILGLIVGFFIGGIIGVLAISLAIVAGQSDRRVAKLDGDFLADLGTDD